MVHAHSDIRRAFWKGVGRKRSKSLYSRALCAILILHSGILHTSAAADLLCLQLLRGTTYLPAPN